MNTRLPPKFYSLWAINGPLERNRLRRQLERFRAVGLDGVVFHPRFYPGKPPYLSDAYFAHVSDAALHARSIGLAFWLYDEDGWPSGTVGGQLLKEFPEHSQRWVGLFARRPETCLEEFEHEGKRWYLAERRGAGVDYLDPRLCQRFISMTYERYRAELSPEAFDHVEAFFCDEPEFGLGHLYDALPPDGAIPWTPRLPERYRERFGEDLRSILPALFFPLDGYAEIRVRFWECVTDLFCDAFVAPLNAWCQQHGKQFTAHIKGEEHPLFQVPMVGSCQQVFRRLSLPGIDALERYPSNDFYPRQVSSVARQFGHGRCMAEAFGGAGWGATPEDLENYLLWLGRHGVTDFVLHLSQYRLDSAAMHDWPPSQPLHLTWTPIYAQVINRVRQELRANPRPAADTLVVAPYRAIMSCYAPWELMQTNIHDAGTYPPTAAAAINSRFLDLIAGLHRAGVRYDVTDERSLEQFGMAGGQTLQLGNSIYQQVIVAEDCQLAHGTLLRLETRRTGPEEMPVPDPSASGMPPPTPAHLTAGSPLFIRWNLARPPVNGWLLECTAEADGWFTAAFTSDMTPANRADLEFFFADDVGRVQLNGSDLRTETLEDGSVARLDSLSLNPANILRFCPLSAVARPFVWLQGSFRLASCGAFTDGPNETLRTDGPFMLVDSHDVLEQNLVTDGFPFLRSPLSAVAKATFPRGAAALRLDGVAADAIRLMVDGKDLGWTWRADGEYRFEGVFPAGTHQIQIELIPNTYNACGPHHYYQGDWPVISPDQIKGVRNFADPTDAPEQTHGKPWHFRRFRLPEAITLFK